MSVDRKYDSLRDTLRSLGKVVVAYSGGVDSTFLLKAAVDTLGPDNVLACIGISGSLARTQYRQAMEMAKLIGATLREVPVDELDDDAYCQNKADRCFHCKSRLYGLLTNVARQQGFSAVVCGSNFDDKDDYRPGNRAASVFGVHCPLMDAQLAKDDIRTLSRKLNLKTADLPASPCLASRISYGLDITEERLKQVELAEDFMRSLGFVEFRVRHHGNIARIEVPPTEISRVAADDTRLAITAKLKEIGFKFVSLDLQGFRSGALNDQLTDDEKTSSL